MAESLSVERGDRGETYWAKEEDDERLISECVERIAHYGRFVANSRLAQRWKRSWKYYHNIFFQDSSGSNYESSTEIKRLGEQGETAGLAANHYRNLLEHLLTLTTQNRPAWNARAVNSDQRSMEQSRLGTNILDYYMREKRVERFLTTAVEHALVLSNGYVHVYWDHNAGQEREPEHYDEEEGSYLWPVQEPVDVGGDEYSFGLGSASEGVARFEGDLAFRCPTLFDIVFDTMLQSWDEKSWVLVRHFENKWDLAARYPDMEEDIASMQHDVYHDFDFRIGAYGDTGVTDRVPVWDFYHRRSDSIPEGRHFSFVGDKMLSPPQALPYKDIPVYGIAPAYTLLTPWGHTPGFDLQGLQEALNNQLSTIVSNAKNFGKLLAWSKKGNDLTAYDISESFSLIESAIEPKVLNLLQESPALYKGLEIFAQHMQFLTGVNDVMRGQTHQDLSGTALALIDSKALQFATRLFQGYYQLLEDVGTAMLRTLRTFAQSERVITILGKRNEEAARKHFTGDDLDMIDRVEVQSGNALSKTLPGRVELAQNLLQGQYHNGRPWVSNPDEFISVLESGNLEPLLEADRAQLALIRDENEQLQAGEGQHLAAATDNHVLHIKEHLVLINSTEARMDQDRVSRVLAAVKEHLDLLRDPVVQQLMATLGYEITVPPVMPQGAPGAPQNGQPQAAVARGQSPGKAPMPQPEETQGVKVRPARMPEPAEPPPAARRGPAA